jgi:hypothetical protein
MQLKEDGNRSGQELEQKKQEQLKEQKEGKGRWREDLASRRARRERFEDNACGNEAGLYLAAHASGED